MEDTDIIYLIYDTETTGLSVKTSGIVQLGFMFVKLTNGKYKILSRDSVYCNPEGIDFTDKGVLKALEINHLNPEFVLRQASEKSILETFFSLSSYYNPKYVIGQNHISYDNEILFNRSTLYGLDDNCCELLSKDHVDTKRYHKAMFPGEKNNLNYMCNKFGIIQENAHDALCDVECTWKLFKKLKSTDSVLDLSSLTNAKKILYKY